MDLFSTDVQVYRFAESSLQLLSLLNC